MSFPFDLPLLIFFKTLFPIACDACQKADAECHLKGGNSKTCSRCHQKKVKCLFTGDSRGSSETSGAVVAAIERLIEKMDEVKEEVSGMRRDLRNFGTFLIST